MAVKGFAKEMTLGAMLLASHPSVLSPAVILASRIPCN